MKTWILAAGLLMPSLLLADGYDASFDATDATSVRESDSIDRAFQGSCVFEGQYASGCIEFAAGAWKAASAEKYCQDQSKAGSSPVVAASFCPRTDYNSLCATTLSDGSVAHVYVNNMPGFICKKYLNGALTKQPAQGWPQP